MKNKNTTAPSLMDKLCAEGRYNMQGAMPMLSDADMYGSKQTSAIASMRRTKFGIEAKKTNNFRPV